MTEQLAIAPMLVALGTAILAILAYRHRGAQQIISVAGALGYLIAVGTLTHQVLTRGPIAYQLSAWDAPFGISVVADALSVFMLSLTAVIACAAVVFSTRYINDFGQGLTYHPLFHLLVAGVTGALLTGDIFNLFVWFEVMLMASYVLVVFYGGPEHTRAGIQYVVLNLVASAVMLLAIGGIYASVGTLNMADLAHRLGDPASSGAAAELTVGLGGLLFAVFALKAGIVPFHFWVPDTYRAAPAPVAAMLAAVVKKVGVYAIIRLYFTVFSAAEVSFQLPGMTGQSIYAFLGPILFVMGVGSILLGGVMAVDRPDLDGLLAYSSISQVGFIVVPLAIGAAVPAVRTLAVSAALIYTLTHALAKGTLYLASGAIAAETGTNEFADLGGLVTRSPAMAVGFFVGAMGLVGIPPLTGFFGKLLVFDTAAQAESGIGVVALLGGAVLTIGYVSRAWNRVFWGEPSEIVLAATRRSDLTVIVVVLSASLLVAGVGFDPIYRFAHRAAETALDRMGYIELVLGVDTS